MSIHHVFAVSTTLLLAVTACTGASGGRSADDSLIADAAGSSSGGASGVPANNGTPTEKITLGRLESEDLRQMIHTALDKRVTKTNIVGDGAEEATELGDGETFQYTVVKLSRGLDDVSGDTAETPDGAEVEVNGWYKRSLAQKEARDNEVTCMSFDTFTQLVRKAGKWVVPNDYQVVFNREDHEDCY